jgi:hypothetical protein
VTGALDQASAALAALASDSQLPERFAARPAGSSGSSSPPTRPAQPDQVRLPPEHAENRTGQSRASTDANDALAPPPKKATPSPTTPTRGPAAVAIAPCGDRWPVYPNRWRRRVPLCNPLPDMLLE